ncbi:MAG: tetratricopeptide repeat protein [Ectothiorhodospiraceae bacterium]|nr:tetratricopeptide repeat protein [Ectothiorhodospiraceae bacterium]
MMRGVAGGCLAIMLALLMASGCTQRPQPATLASLPAQLKDETPVDVPDQSRSRDRAISVYTELLDGDNLPEDMRGEVLRRLADLRLERLEAALADNPERDYGVELGRTIALYETRLQTYPDHPRNDQVLYQLSRAYDHDRQAEAALDALTRLAADYPGSALYAESQFRRGETLFAGRDYAAAGGAYGAVLAQGQDSGFYAQALYKRGWALFRQERFEHSIDVFLTLIDHEGGAARLRDPAVAEAERERIEDSLRAISLGFSHLGGPAAVSDYFRRHGHRPDEDLVYAELAERYLEQDRYSDAATSYGEFVTAHPLGDQAPRLQLQVIESFRQGGFSGEMLVAKRRYAELFDLAGPYWQQRQPGDSPATVEALEHNITVLAQHAHASFQQDSKPADLGQAEYWYQRYLANFPDAARSQEMHFLYAELLFEATRFSDAAHAYEQAAYRYEPNRRAAESGYAALLAYDAHAETLDGAEAAMAEWERASLASARRFTRSFPEHPEAASGLGLSIDRWFRREETAAAEEAAQWLLDRYPEADPQARLTAWVVLGHIAFDREDFAQAEAAYRQALASPALSDEQRPDFAERLAASIYRQGEVARSEGDTATAIDHFLRVPESRARAVAVYDAAHLLAAREDWLATATVLEDFRRDYPDHALQAEATRTLAVAYASSSQPARAATELLRIDDASENPVARRESIREAAPL